MNNRIVRAGLAFVCGALGLASGSAHAANYHWVGVKHGAWNNPANWLPQGIPSKGDNVVIGAKSRVSVASGATVANLRVGAGAEINNGGNLQVTGKTTSSGLFTGEGTLLVPSGATANFSVNASTMRGCALPSSGSNRGMAPVVFGPIINRGHIVTRVAKGCRASFASIRNTGLLEVVSDGTTKFQDIQNRRHLNMNVAGTLTLAKVENMGGATLSIAATTHLTSLSGSKATSFAVHLDDLLNRKGGSVTLSGAKGGRMFDGKSIHNEGELQLSGAQTLLKENVTNAAGATLTLDSNASVLPSDASAPKFLNAGKLIKPAGSDATLNVEWNNTGQVVVENGTLHVRIPAGKACKQNAGTTTLEGGVLSVEDAAGTKSTGIYEVAGGTLGGIGTIEGNLINSGGRVKPGHSPGTITINGNYFQTDNGMLEIELGGTAPGSYDQILVNGTAYLDGCLEVVRWGGFVPAPGDVYVLLTYYAKSGNFDELVDALPVPGITYDTTLGSSDFELNCYGQAPPPDNTAPTATISTPTNNASLRTITGATGTSSDTIGVSNVTCRLYRYNNPATGVAAAFWAGGSSWTSAATAANERAATGTSTWNFAFPALVPGRYSLRATAKDASGNAGSSATFSFYVDPNAPSVLTISAPASGTTVSGIPNVAGTASDASDGSGLSGVKGQLRRNSDGLYWNGSTWAAPAHSFSVTLSGVNWSRSTNMPSGTNLVAGSYSLIATATDRAGNTKALTSTFSVAPSGGDAPASGSLS